MRIKLTVIIFAILFLLPVCANATINSNSKVLDGIEYYVQTDKSTYQPGENVEMLYKITNLSEQSITLRVANDPAWNFWAEKDGSQIWQAVNGWWEVETQFTLAPGQSYQFPDWGPSPLSPFLWNLKDSTGNIVGIGNYDITGGLFGLDNTKVSVPIVITPEPTSLIFLAIGLPVVRTFLRRKR